MKETEPLSSFPPLSTLPFPLSFYHSHPPLPTMPKVPRRTRRAVPKGFDEVEPVLQDFSRKLKDAENEPHEGKRKVEILWPIMRLHHQRSRYIYDLYYKRKTASKELFDYLIREGYGDGPLISKWRKQGFEKLCCLRCIQARDTNFGTACICRVPKAKMEEGKVIECVHCGCRGCCSSD